MRLCISNKFLVNIGIAGQDHTGKILMQEERKARLSLVLVNCAGPL